MSGGQALATRPTNAPRNPAVRQATARIEHSATVRREPDPVRPTPPPQAERYVSPGRPAYIPQPPRPEKLEKAETSKAEPKAKPEGPDPGGPAAAPTDGAAGKDAAGADGGGEDKAGAAAEGGAAGEKTKDKGKTSKLVQVEKPDPLPEVVEVPQPELGAVAMERETARLSDPASSFDAPLALPIRPVGRADAKKDEKDKDVAIYVAVFAEAAAAARTLHDALISDARGAASAARAASSNAADRRQMDLDRSLASLDDGLNEALSTVDMTCDEALALIDQRAAHARALIRRAAAGAHAALIAATARVYARKAPADRMRLASEAKAAGYRASLVTKAGLAITQMLALGAMPQTVFPVPFMPMARAVNEAIVTRAPKRAEHRMTAYAKELFAQSTAMAKSFDLLPGEFAKAFATVDGWILNTSKAGPAAVESARAAANKELAKMARQLRGAVRAGRARSKAALVRQHDAARRQTIMAHKARAKGEAVGESRRGEKDVIALKSLGVAQGPATRLIAENLGKQANQDEKAYAKAVVTASRGFAARVAQTNGGQRSKLNEAASDGRELGERVSRASGQRLREQSETVAAQQVQAGREAADGVFAQANDTSSSFDKLAKPVAKSMSAYLPPIGLAFELQILKLMLGVIGVDVAIESYIATGKAIEPAGAKPAEGKKDDAKSLPDPPKMTPKEYMELTSKVGADPKVDPQIAELMTKAAAEIPKTIATKSAAVWDNISSLGTNTEGVIGALRMITQKQGSAIKWFFRKTYERDIEAYIRTGLPKVLSARSTDELNVSAAINYLNGNQIEGALADLKAAVNYSNEEARVEKIQRSLSPAQWATLNLEHADEIKDVRNDLDGVDQQVFDALQSEGDKYLKSQEIGPQREEDMPGAGVAQANALRLREKIGRDRNKRGDEGADAAADTIENAALDAGADALSGADQLGLDEHRIDKLDVTDAAGERNKQSWEATKKAFDQQSLPPGFQGPLPGTQPGWSIVAFASAKRDYKIWVKDSGDPYGGHVETLKDQGISDHQTRLMKMLVEKGPDSEEVAAARLMVEMHRDAGRPKPERVEKAMHMTELDARVGEDKSKLKPEEKKARLDAAKARQEAVLRKVYEFQNPGKKGSELKDPDTVRKSVTDDLTKLTKVFDPTAAEMSRRAMRGPKDKWEDEQTERRQDANAAFDYAIVHEADRADTLKRTFGRMDKDEITLAVAQWDVKAMTRGEAPLYTQLNLFERGHWMIPSKLSGDERNDVELAAMGVARNDTERALIARMRAQQQIRDAGLLGKLAGKITGDWDRLKDSRDRIDELLGLPEGAVDAMGRLKALGANINPDGSVKPPPGGSGAELELAMHMTHLTAESYKTMTDKLATAVTTGLMVIAAVVTTALTGGAAASIWIPMLVTAGAGLIGIGLSAAIKGDRYTPADMERDLVMTFVQAATAGLGAAAGVAIKGGMPALRAVGSKMLLSEKVLEGVIKTGGKGLSKGWGLVAEIGVGAGSNAINNYAGAYMDPRNRQLGVSAEKAEAAGWSGLLSGGFSSLIMRPAGAFGQRVAGGYGQRAIGGAVSNVAGKYVELKYQDYTGERRIESSADFADELKTAGATGVVQGVAEEAAGRRTDARRAAQAARAPPEATPRAAAPRAPVEEHAAPTPRPDAEPAAPPTPTARPQAETPAAPHAAAQEPIPLPIPPQVAGIAKEAQQLRPVELPPVAIEPTAAPKPAPPEPAGPPPIPGSARPASSRPADEDGPQTVKRPTTEETPPSQPGGKRKPPKGGAEPHPDIPWAPDDFLEGAVMLDAHASSRAEVDKAYWNTIRSDPSREVAVYRNPVTGEHIVIFGDADSVFISPHEGVREGPAGAGLTQKWKDMLPGDIGRWELEAHYHPGFSGQHDQAPLARRVPSTGEGGIGDFQVLRGEAAAAGGQRRESVIHWTHEGRDGHTVFGHDPNATDGGKYWIDVENPATGKRETHRFEDIPAYEKWARDQGITTSRDAAPPGAHDPSRPGSTRPDEELTVRHGTTQQDALAISTGGIDPHRRSGVGDDFSRGFYMTLDEPNAATYANTRAAQHPDRGGPATIGATVKLSDLGVVVDVRTGGEHRAAWDEFLNRSPPAFPTGPEAAMWATAREYASNTGRYKTNESQRGAVFEAFLQSQGLGHADAVRGDLGRDALTGGISAAGGGEQIAIRSRKAANVLNERMGYPLIPDAPAIPGSAKPKAEVEAAASEKPGILKTSEEKQRDHRQLSEAELAALGIVRPPPLELPEHSEAAKADHQAKLKAIDDEGVANFRSARPDEAKLYDQLRAVAPEVLDRAVRSGAAPAKMEAALREALAAKKVPQAQIEEHVTALKVLLRPTEARTGDYRAALETGAVTNPAVEKWKETHRPTNPGEAPKRGSRKGQKGSVQVMEPADYAAALARQMDTAAEKHQKADPTYGAGIREFVNVARERAAWQDLVPGDLAKRVEAAIDKELAIAGVRKMRERKPLVPTETEANPTPHREAFQALDEIDRPLLTELSRRVTNDPAQNALLAAEWAARRQGAPGVTATDIAREVGQLTAVLDHPELLGLINQERATQASLNIDHSKIRDVAMSDHLLLSLAATDPDTFAWAFAQLATHVPSDKSTPRQTLFPAEVIRAGLRETMTAHLKPALSEASSAFRLAAEIGAVALEVPSMTKARTNDGGIDAALVVPPEFRYPPTVAAGEPENVRVILVDDKAEQAKQLSKVPALTTNLAENLRTMGQEHLDAIAFRETLPKPEGLSPYDLALRQHLENVQAQAVKQIMAAAAEIDNIPADTRAGGIKSESYGKAVAKILKDHGIEMKITSEYGNIVTLPEWMQHWGFAVWDAEKAARRKQAAAPEPGDDDN